MTPAEKSVAAYYDANTRSFIATGQGAKSIRRAVWADGVKKCTDAFRVADQRVLAAISVAPTPRRVVDLGCGIGSSLLWLRARADFEGIGLTISQTQAALAAASFSAAQRLTCMHGSYTALPDSIQDVSVAFSIEAFVHSPSVTGFLAPIASRLKRGGRLLICDDFLGPAHMQHGKLLDDVRYGWLASTLASPDDLVRAGRPLGLKLVSNEDFTDRLELGRPRDQLLRAVVAVGRPLRFPGWLFRSWVGGVALERALKRRALEYRLLTFEKS